MADADVLEVAYCLLVDGIAVSFWSNEDAASTVDVGRATAHTGLELPRVSMGISLASGWMTSQAATFVIQDNDGTLADLFASTRDDVAELEHTLEAYATAPSAVMSKHVGTEYIGSSGERRQYPVIEGWNVGERHPGKNDSDAMGIGSTPVSAKPLVWGGRRVALYRFTKVDGIWQTWSASKLLWWGSLRGTGHVKAHRWQLRADGPDSWLRKQGGFSSFAGPAMVSDATINFTENEKTVHAQFIRYRPTTSTVQDYVQVYGSDTETIAGDTVSDVETAISTAISTAIAATGAGSVGEFNGTDDPGAPFQKEPKGSASFGVGNGNALSIEIEANSDSGLIAEGVLLLTASEAAWKSVGYDPQVQRDITQAGDGSEYFLRFEVSSYNYGAPIGEPYWTAHVSTRPLDAGNDWSLWDNGGNPREYLPVFGNGEGDTYVLKSSAGQEIYLEYGPAEGWAIEGQNDIPPAEDPDSPGTAYTFTAGGEVDSTRLFAFVGPRRIAGTDVEFACVWVGRCSWANDAGMIGRNGPGLDAPSLYVSEWLDPALFGFREEVAGGNDIDTDWLAPKGTIACYPLHNIGHTADGYADSPVKLVRNMLVTSGTGTGWYTDASYTDQQFGNGGKVQPGDNDLQTFSLRPADYEISDLGCAIPADLVQHPLKWAAAADKINPELRKVKLVYAGGFSTEDVILGMLRPLGLCIGLPGGKYGIVAPWDGVSLSDIAHTITPEDYHAAQPKDGIQRQTMMAHTPIDVVRISYGWNPVDATNDLEVALRANDKGARFRRQKSEIEIDAPGYGVSSGFRLELQRRWSTLFDYHNRRNFKVQGVALHFRDDIWPGDLVQWTDPWLVDQSGAYGVTIAVGVITSVTHHAKTEQTTVDAVLFEAPADSYRVCAPLARVVRYDSSGPTLYCAKDHFGAGAGGLEHIDVSAFAEPAWSSDGGDASIAVWQYDGNTWYTAGYQTVDSVDAVANTITLSGALSGGTGYYRDRDSVVVFRERANQAAAWVVNNHAPIADDSGEVVGNAAHAVKWNDA